MMTIINIIIIIIINIIVIYDTEQLTGQLVIFQDEVVLFRRCFFSPTVCQLHTSLSLLTSHCTLYHYMLLSPIATIWHSGVAVRRWTCDHAFNSHQDKAA